MKELRIFNDRDSGLVFYEVVEGTFVQSNSLFLATASYQQQSGRIGRNIVSLRESFPNVRLMRPDPRELRDFDSTGGHRPFELIPGHAVYSHSREGAEELYRHHCSVLGSDPRTFGAKIDESFLRSYKVTGSAHVTGYNMYGITLEVDEEKPQHIPRLWTGPHGQPYWEVAPGKVVGAGTLEQAQERYKKDSSYWTFDTTSRAIDAIQTGYTGPIPAPSTSSITWKRRFVDKDTDLVWLMHDEDGNEVLSYGVDPEEAADLDDPEDRDTPEGIVRKYGPLVELFETGGVGKPFNEWPPPEDALQSNPTPSTQDEEEPLPSQASNETEMPMKLNTDGSITEGPQQHSEDEQSGRRRPMALDTLKDSDGRTWWRLPSGHWLCEAELRRSSRSATGAWNYWRDTGFDRFLGHEKGDMTRQYGPMTKPSMDLLEEEGIDFGNTFDISSHCRCTNRGLLTENQEEAKQLKVGGFTHCIDCGKLRP